MDTQKNALWLERVEEIINVLNGSSVSEIELTEGDTAITIRRSPNMVLTAVPDQVGGAPVVGSVGPASLPTKKDTTIAVVTPLTGVYYSAPSPTTPAFANVGDVIHVGQVVALIEAMKVFNEITAEVSGRVVSIVASNGDVIQKGDAFMRVEPV